MMPLSFFPFPFLPGCPSKHHMFSSAGRWALRITLCFMVLCKFCSITELLTVTSLLLFDSKGTGALYLEHSFGSNHLKGLWIPTEGMNPHGGNGSPLWEWAHLWHHTWCCEHTGDITVVVTIIRSLSPIPLANLYGELCRSSLPSVRCRGVAEHCSPPFPPQPPCSRLPPSLSPAATEYLSTPMVPQSMFICFKRYGRISAVSTQRVELF